MMILGDDTAALVDEDPPLDTERLDLVFEDTRIDQDPASDTEFGILVDKTGRDHTDTIFLVPDLNSVTGIRANTAAGDDYGLVLVGNVGNNLALSLIPKKSTNDDSTDSLSFM